jgi:hypothetical protein
MLSKQEEMEERIETLRNDADVRKRQQQQGSTLLDHHHDETDGGRFGALGQQIVTGRPSPKIPQLPASSPWSGAQPEPGEEPGLGYSIEQVERD